MGHYKQNGRNVGHVDRRMPQIIEWGMEKKPIILLGQLTVSSGSGSLPVAPSLERKRDPNLGEDTFFSLSSFSFCFKSIAPVPARAKVPSLLLPLVLANSGAAGTIVTSSVGGDLRAILNLSFERGVP